MLAHRPPALLCVAARVAPNGADVVPYNRRSPATWQHEVLALGAVPCCSTERPLSPETRRPHAMSADSATTGSHELSRRGGSTDQRWAGTPFRSATTDPAAEIVKRVCPSRTVLKSKHGACLRLSRQRAWFTASISK